MRDRITGFSGTVVSISYDVAGCVHGLLSPEAKEGKLLEREWFDTKRLQAIDAPPKMEPPTFGQPPGGEDLPKRRDGP